MRAEDLLDAIGEAREDYIQDAGIRHRTGWKKWGALAAVIALCVGIGWILTNMGGRAGKGNGVGSGEGLVYMSYEGPILPLTLQSETAGLTAVRHVDFDFSPYEDREETYESSDGQIETYTRYDSASIITDRYLLRNSTDSDLTVTAYYPFTGTLNNREGFPEITQNDISVTADLHPGAYSGGFTGAYGDAGQETGSLNIQNIDRFSGYEALLSDGAYQASAFEVFPQLTQTVTVYQMTEYVYSSDSEAENPSLQMEFHADPENTRILTYGINGFSSATESGYYALRNGGVRYNPNLDEPYQRDEDAYVIVIGKDIDSYTVTGYRDGSCETVLEDLGCTVLRYEATLGEILLALLEPYTERHLAIAYGDATVSEPGLYCGLAAELLTTYGILGDDPAERYESGRLEDIFSAVHSDKRVFYLSFDLTVPAGETVTLKAVLYRTGSMNFVGKNKDREGYDMATNLGSNLQFTGQSASITRGDLITILNQNFGFDPENGIVSVILDPAENHYYLEVQKKKK